MMSIGSIGRVFNHNGRVCRKFGKGHRTFVNSALPEIFEVARGTIRKQFYVLCMPLVWFIISFARGFPKMKKIAVSLVLAASLGLAACSGAEEATTEAAADATEAAADATVEGAEATEAAADATAAAATDATATDAMAPAATDAAAAPAADAKAGEMATKTEEAKK